VYLLYVEHWGGLRNAVIEPKNRSKNQSKTLVRPITEGRPFSKHPGTSIETMITIATNNSAVNLAIHRAGRYLHLKSSQTLYTAQPNRKLQPFYAKQTQFPKSQNELNPPLQNGLWRVSCLQPAPKQTQFQSPHRRSEFIPTRRGCPLVSSLLIFVFRICFGFRYSDFVLQPNNYAKQTQFSKRQNGPKPLRTKGL